MKSAKWNKVGMLAGAALALSVGNAFATPVFGVDQTAITGGTYTGPATFDGTQGSGNASELLRFSNSFQNVTVNSGFLRISSIFNENTASSLGINASSVAGNYGLYVIFNLTSTYDAGKSTGAPGSAGSVYDLTSLNFTFYADTKGDTTFQTSNSAGAGTEANRSGGFGDDVVLAFGSLIPGQGVVGFDTGGGAFENALTNFALCTGPGTATVGAGPVPGTGNSSGTGCTNGEGKAYFYKPSPFYPLAFNAFNNTGNSLGALNGNLLSINQSVGAISFQAVPEPSSVALMGIAALGLALSVRRRRKA